jgi:uncharacterized repeat protein (TIGR03803 family)
LYSFTGGVDGAVPNGGLVRDSAGNLYGVTNAGGNLSVCNGYGCGVVFELTPSGTETVLYAFNDANGSGPSGSLILDPTGYLYGVAEYGGTESGGVVFKVPTVMLQLQ